MSSKREIFISVDVETAGPIPGEFSLLSIGACDVDDESRSFAEAEVNAGLVELIKEAFAIRNQLLSGSHDSIEAMSGRLKMNKGLAHFACSVVLSRP
jgi:hypothetical protein